MAATRTTRAPSRSRRCERIVVGLLVLISLGVAPARADEVVVRGNYYRDRNTRVLQPSIDLSKELPNGTIVGAHYLLDAITSASLAAGVIRDQPFTELRNEVGVSVGQRIGRGVIGASYSYSSESDYWAHFVSVSGALDLCQHNTNLSLSVGYGNNTVGQRMGPTVFTVIGGLQTLNVVAGFAQVLSPTALLNLGYELGVIGFGNRDNGLQANPYRTVLVGGAPAREEVPFQRIRHSFTGSVNVSVPLGLRLMPFLAFRPSVRVYVDDWGIDSFTPELRTYVPIGPVELRVTGRYYTQGEASFWSDVDGRPFYPSQGKPCSSCLWSGSQHRLFVTSDPKLSAFDSMFVELRLLLHLHGLARLTHLPLHSFLSEGFVELSYGHYFNDRYAHEAFGDADVAGLTFAFPL